MRRQAARVVCGDGMVSMVAGGSLIHTLAGRGFGCGQRPRNRSGCASYAARRVTARRAWTCAQEPSWTDAGVCMAMPECRCSVLYYVKNAPQKAFASWMEPKRPGKAGQYFRVLNADSE
jgi:hypothetical protein